MFLIINRISRNFMFQPYDYDICMQHIRCCRPFFYSNVVHPRSQFNVVENHGGLGFWNHISQNKKTTATNIIYLIKPNFDFKIRKILRGQQSDLSELR